MEGQGQGNNNAPPQQAIPQQGNQNQGAAGNGAGGDQAPAVAPLPNNRAGYYDTPAGWATALRRVNIGGSLVAQHTTNNFMRDNSVFSMISLLAYARIRIIVSGFVQEGAHVAYFVMEALSFDIPAHLRLPQQPADDRIVADVRALWPLTNKGLSAARIGGALELYNNRFPEGFMYDQDALLAQDPPQVLDYNRAVAVIRLMACCWYPNNIQDWACSVFVTFIVAVAKMGNLTDHFINKIVASVEAELSVALREEVFSLETVRTVWDCLRSYINDENVAQAVARWSAPGYFPQYALRMHIIVSQMAGEGVTALSIIKQALVAYPTFPWNQVAHLFPTEMANIQAAFVAVGTNQYYGYRRNLGAARGSLFKNIAWVAKELLVRKGGYSSLAHSKSFVRRPSEMTRLNEIINNFIDTQNQEPTAEQLAAQNATVANVQAAAATATGLV